MTKTGRIVLLIIGLGAAGGLAYWTYRKKQEEKEKQKSPPATAGTTRLPPVVLVQEKQVPGTSRTITTIVPQPVTRSITSGLYAWEPYTQKLYPVQAVPVGGEYILVAPPKPGQGGRLVL